MRFQIDLFVLLLAKPLFKKILQSTKRQRNLGANIKKKFFFLLKTNDESNIFVAKEFKKTHLLNNNF